MSGRSATELLGLLTEMDTAARANVVDLGEQKQRREMLVYVAFLVCGRRVLSRLNELREIIYVPEFITRVPRVQTWVRGVANVRGSLLPVMDLQLFLCGAQQGETTHTRVLVVERGGIRVGLQVPAVYGLRHIPADIGMERDFSVSGTLRDVISGCYRMDDGMLPVFSVDALAQHPKFRVGTL